MKKFVLISIFIITLCSCTNNFANIMLRTYDDPFEEAPNVESYREEGKIYINWSEDKGADEIILLRAEDNSAQYYFVELYRGKNLYYIDTDLNPTDRYLYRLYKVRGNQLFKTTKTAYGYCSEKRGDTLGNHTKETAKLLEYPFDNLTLYCEKFCDGSVHYEEDWYKVRIPARSVASIKVEQRNPKPNGTHKIEYWYEGYPFINVNNSFEINNQSLWEDYFYFKLRVEQSNAPSPGVMNLTYGIKIINIQPIN